MALSTACQATKLELSLSIDIALTVLDAIVLQTSVVIFYKFKGMTISSMMLACLVTR